MSFPVHALSLGRLKSVLPLALLAVLAAACDSAPGVAPLDNRPPRISNLSYTPAIIDPAAGDAQFPVADGNVTVPLTVQATAVDPDGEVTDVLFVLEAPGLGRRVAVSGRMEPADEGRYEAAATAALPIDEPGLYSLVVYATDDQGRLSNQVRGSLRLLAPPDTAEEVGGE